MTRILLVSLLLVCGVSAGQGRFLNVACLSLPEEYLAGIPMENRGMLLMKLSGSTRHDLGYDDRLDYENGYLEYYNDAPHHSVGATSCFWVKLFHREKETPLVFVHVRGDRSIKDPDPPAQPVGVVGTTALLEWTGSKWKDVTEVHFPKGMDMNCAFVPQRKGQTIRVIPLVRKAGRDGRGFYWGEGPGESVLGWDGRRFEVREESKAGRGG